MESEYETWEDDGAGEGEADDGGAGDSSLSLSLLLSIVGGVGGQEQKQQMRPWIWKTSLGPGGAIFNYNRITS